MEDPASSGRAAVGTSHEVDGHKEEHADEAPSLRNKIKWPIWSKKGEICQPGTKSAEQTGLSNIFPIGNHCDWLIDTPTIG